MSNLDKILSSLNKKYKSENLLTRATDQVVEVEWIPTNIFGLDRVMGKGLPRGRIVEIWGPPASGKSTTALQIISDLFELFDELNKIVENYIQSSEAYGKTITDQLH